METNKKILLAISFAALGIAIFVLVRKLRKKQVEPEDLAGETKPIIVTQ